MGSVTILTGGRRFLRGVNTMRPASMLASSGSPARMPSRRRRGPGRTTCPFVETLVCVVRQSYLSGSLGASPRLPSLSIPVCIALLPSARRDKIVGLIPQTPRLFSAAMDCCVASIAHRDQVLLRIVARVTSKIFMVHPKVGHRAAELASPTVAT